MTKKKQRRSNQKKGSVKEQLQRSKKRPKLKVEKGGKLKPPVNGRIVVPEAHFLAKQLYNSRCKTVEFKQKLMATGLALAEKEEAYAALRKENFELQKQLLHHEAVSIKDANRKLTAELGVLNQNIHKDVKTGEVYYLESEIPKDATLPPSPDSKPENDTDSDDSGDADLNPDDEGDDADDGVEMTEEELEAAAQ